MIFFDSLHHDIRLFLSIKHKTIHGIISALSGSVINATDMKTNIQKTEKPSLTLKRIFRCMMEGGYYPVYEKTHILFDMDDNIGVVEYEDGVLAVRLFFSIEEEAYSLFTEVGNTVMQESDLVKPVILDDRRNLMFSCETMCDNVREFRKFFPRCIEMINETLVMHKSEVKNIIMYRDSRTRTKVVS